MHDPEVWATYGCGVPDDSPSPVSHFHLCKPCGVSWTDDGDESTCWNCGKVTP